MASFRHSPVRQVALYEISLPRFSTLLFTPILSSFTIDAVAGFQIRIIIRACVEDIPDDVLRRPITLGELLCTKVYNRKLSTSIQSSGFDDVHIPRGFDSEEPTKTIFY
jgi:hypothetical protein